jgi:hypothetical protein
MSLCLELSFVKDSEGGRNFWSVDHSGDYQEQWRRGELYALEALDLMARDDEGQSRSHLLGWVALDMSHSSEGKRVCAWDGCTRSISFEKMTPPDWHSLIVYWSPFVDPKNTLEEVCSGPSCYRDAVLCPEHSKALDGLLKNIGREVSGPPAGTA